MRCFNTSALQCGGGWLAELNHTLGMHERALSALQRCLHIQPLHTISIRHCPSHAAVHHCHVAAGASC
jgi:hypothetical protein